MVDEKERGPWMCEADDGGGVYVYNADDHHTLNRQRLMFEGHPTELAAWEYGLSCLLIRRDQVAANIKAARSEVRRLKRKKPS